MRLFLTLLCLCGGLFSIDAAMKLAPAMTWPATEREWLATYALTLGTGLYLVGMVLLGNIGRRA